MDWVLLVAIVIIVTGIIVLGAISNARTTPQKTIDQFQITKHYYKCPHSDFTQVEKNVLEKYGLVASKSKDNWDIYFPCGYTHAEKEIVQLHPENNSKQKVVVGVNGMDSLAGKDSLCRIMKQKYGALRALVYIPPTWILYDKKDLADLEKYLLHNPSGMFILKKNIQRQEGILITSDRNKIINGFSSGYVVAQGVLTNVFLIDGRKINIRVYLAIKCDSNKKIGYVHDNGFLYYTRNRVTKGNTFDEIVTTGYIDRRVYEQNPMTIKEWTTTLSEDQKKKLIGGIDYVLKGLLDAMDIHLCQNDRSNKKGNTYCQMFGVDLQPNSDLTDIKIIEVNKGADMGIKDQRDGNVKTTVMDDFFKMCGITATQSTTSGFRCIWQKLRGQD